jgi:hypothetical protein
MSDIVAGDTVIFKMANPVQVDMLVDLVLQREGESVAICYWLDRDYRMQAHEFPTRLLTKVGTGKAPVISLPRVEPDIAQPYRPHGFVRA